MICRHVAENAAHKGDLFEFSDTFLALPIRNVKGSDQGVVYIIESADAPMPVHEA